MVDRKSSNLPPGFRFHPTDEELIMYYLKNQATSRPCPVSIIPEVDIYKFDPWQLPEKAEFGENEWYFFTPRDRKYPNGVRPNRAAVSGYWKATGTDKAIYSGSKFVGVKKALVFYRGKPPKGSKTDWIMHEYRLSNSKYLPNKQSGSMRLDDWVLCRIYKKKALARSIDIKVEDPSDNIVANNALVNDAFEAQQQTLKLPRPCSLSRLWELDYLGSISEIFSQNSYNAAIDSQNIFTSQEDNIMPLGMEKFQLGEKSNQYSSDAFKFSSGQTSILSQSIYTNFGFQFQ